VKRFCGYTSNWCAISSRSMRRRRGTNDPPLR
jgi:hypothetical protein